MSTSTVPRTPTPGNGGVSSTGRGAECILSGSNNLLVPLEPELAQQSSLVRLLSVKREIALAEVLGVAHG